MFTGIIEEIGTVKEITPRELGKSFQIQANLILDDLKVDQSVAVNGVCLTVVKIGKDFFSADAVEETLSKSTLTHLNRHDKVNLERALRFQDRLGGHLVQGHVDGVGTIRQFANQPHACTISVEILAELERYAISKGSITIDGISLTIANKNSNLITVAIIPHTIKQTTLQFKKTGDVVNIEVDFLAKYIEQFVNRTSETKITSGWLKEQGF